jgi:hypothetical protein
MEGHLGLVSNKVSQGEPAKVSKVSKRRPSTYGFTYLTHSGWSLEPEAAHARPADFST